MGQFNQPPKSNAESLEEKRVEVLAYVTEKYNNALKKVAEQSAILEQLRDEAVDLMQSKLLIKDGAPREIDKVWEEMQESQK